MTPKGIIKMNFSKTTEYALRILGIMSQKEGELYTTKEVFEISGIPYRYLRKQMNELVNTGFLISIQGKTGGYKISRPLVDINLLEVVKACEDFNLENQCFFGFNDCPKVEKCAMHDKYGEVRDSIFNILKTTSLKDLKSENLNTFSLNINI